MVLLTFNSKFNSKICDIKVTNLSFDIHKKWNEKGHVKSYFNHIKEKHCLCKRLEKQRETRSQLETTWMNLHGWYLMNNFQFGSDILKLMIESQCFEYWCPAQFCCKKWMQEWRAPKWTGCPTGRCKDYTVSLVNDCLYK